MNDMKVICTYNTEHFVIFFCTTSLDKNGINNVIAAPDKSDQ